MMSSHLHIGVCNYVTFPLFSFFPSVMARSPIQATKESDVTAAAKGSLEFDDDTLIGKRNKCR